ncbi:hypothetical protein BH10PSE19_BH10PSE19_02660 [soil metagenome]
MVEAKPTILYVDDEPSNLTAFVAAFRRQYNVLIAKSAQDGLEILRREKVHVIVTDQRMPEMTGVQFLEAILPEFPDPVRMILTGFTDLEAIIKAINTGQVYRYITKPWEQRELKLILDNAINLYILEQKNRELIEKLQHAVIDQQRIMNLFQKYVPERVVREALASDNSESIIHGEYRIVSIMFVDIRGFTTIAENLDPNATVELLNDYFFLMCQCVKANKGSVNMLMGDGILAVFGAPMSYIDNSSNAVFCGLAMIKALEQLNLKYATKLGHDIAIGIGINTGEVVAGNIGTEDKVEYTMIGDTVNVAERIQELTKSHPNSILISESTYNPVKNSITVEEVEPQTIRGRTEKMKLYRVTGAVSDAVLKKS